MVAMLLFGLLVSSTGNPPNSSQRRSQRWYFVHPTDFPPNLQLVFLVFLLSWMLRMEPLGVAGGFPES